jgi:hypothetical protein
VELGCTKVNTIGNSSWHPDCGYSGPSGAEAVLIVSPKYLPYLANFLIFIVLGFARRKGCTINARVKFQPRINQS